MITIGVDPHPNSHTVAALKDNGTTHASLTGQTMLKAWRCFTDLRFLSPSIAGLSKVQPTAISCPSCASCSSEPSVAFSYASSRP